MLTVGLRNRRSQVRILSGAFLESAKYGFGVGNVVENSQTGDPVGAEEAFPPDPPDPIAKATSSVRGRTTR
jgi:hypothetical protein